jgi:hypothetical protein
VGNCRKTNDPLLICSPCSSCDSTENDVRAALPSMLNITMGGNKGVIWQYWIDCVGNCGCGTNGDWDASPQIGDMNFVPNQIVSTAPEEQYVESY